MHAEKVEARSLRRDDVLITPDIYGVREPKRSRIRNVSIRGSQVLVACADAWGATVRAFHPADVVTIGRRTDGRQMS